MTLEDPQLRNLSFPDEAGLMTSVPKHALQGAKPDERWSADWWQSVNQCDYSLPFCPLASKPCTRTWARPFVQPTKLKTSDGGGTPTDRAWAWTGPSLRCENTNSVHPVAYELFCFALFFSVQSSTSVCVLSVLWECKSVETVTFNRTWPQFG